MKLQRIFDTSHPLWDQAWKLYQRSFPVNEQRTLECQLRAMEDPLFHFNLLFDSKSGKLIGVISWWDATSFRFCEHFAISPDLRRRGYGARALKFLCNSPDRPVILEAEWPVDYISTLRVEFYLRNGFRGNPAYEHVHYAYHWWGAPHRMLMMSWPRKITLEEFLLFKRFNNLYPLSYSECNEAR